MRPLVTPKLFEGGIVKGFQRGRDIGFKTANLDPKCYASDKAFLKEYHQSVMLGFCELDSKPYPCVISLGDNPYFKNEEVTIEVHLLHKFPEDFYEKRMKVLMLGKIRSMLNIDIPSLDALIKMIQADCDFASDWLEKNGKKKELLKQRGGKKAPEKPVSAATHAAVE